MSVVKLLTKIESVSARMHRYGRGLVATSAYDHIDGKVNSRVLDIGCGCGDDLQEIKQTVGRMIAVFGVESYAPYRTACEHKGITVSDVDIERARLPYLDNYFDVVIINQVLEHCKDIFWVMSEIHRVLAPGGMVIVGVPNMATWHDRLMLLLGQQPREAKVMGPHVRGFTRPALKEFVSCDGYFDVRKISGVGFRPFPVIIQKLLAWIAPGMATSIFLTATKTEKPGSFIDILKTRYYETNYKVS
jgi:methionine biosynthesis protein MetW